MVSWVCTYSLQGRAALQVLADLHGVLVVRMSSLLVELRVLLVDVVHVFAFVVLAPSAELLAILDTLLQFGSHALDVVLPGPQRVSSLLQLWIQGIGTRHTSSTRSFRPYDSTSSSAEVVATAVDVAAVSDAAAAAPGKCTSRFLYPLYSESCGCFGKLDIRYSGND